MEKTIINLTTPLLALDGTATEVMLSAILASNMAVSTSEDAIKVSEWARKLYKGEPLELDTSDLIVFKDYVKASQLRNLVKSQIQLYLAEL